MNIHRLISGAGFFCLLTSISLLQAQTSAFSSYDRSGPYTAVRIRNVGPGGAYDIFKPGTLGANGEKHAIITWGNGTGASVTTYAGLLQHLATHGFVVIASQSSSTGSGSEMAAGIDWLLQENARSASTYYQKLNAQTAGATGHSQGGAGTIQSLRHTDKITSIAPLAPATFTAPFFYSTSHVKVPMFIMVGADDNLANPTSVRTTSWGSFGSSEIGLYGELTGATHFEETGDAGKFRKYVTAWFDATLNKNPQALAMIFDSANGALHKTPTEWSRLLHKNLAAFRTPEENRPPVVTWYAPSDGNKLVPAGSELRLVVRATDPDGQIAKVEFYCDNEKIGETTTHTLNHFGFTWNSLEEGCYDVKALATDNSGNVGNSETIVITVEPATTLEPVSDRISSSAMIHQDKLVLEIPHGEQFGVAIYSMNGSLVYKTTLSTSHRLPLTSLSAGGGYIAIVKKGELIMLRQKIVPIR